jgi:hypothetical protein
MDHYEISYSCTYVFLRLKFKMIFKLPVLDTYVPPPPSLPHFLKHPTSFKILLADFYAFLNPVVHFNTSENYAKLREKIVGRRINHRTEQRWVLTLLTS